jgi:hypothetical protein
LNVFYKIIRGETIIVKIKKKSDISFWQYQILGLLSLFINNSKDYFFITERRVLLIVKNEIITNIQYQNFGKISFNPLNDTLKISIKENEEKIITLKPLRLSYEEIQYLKKKINK